MKRNLTLFALPFAVLVTGLLHPAALYSQCNGGPCDAMRYSEGAAWNANGTINDGPQANGGIIRCGNSAETQSNVQPNSCYDPTEFTINPQNCVDPSTGQAVNVAAPLPGQPVTWFNFDVRANAGNFDFQLVSNDNLAWALYRSTSITMPQQGAGISGNCNSLLYFACGTEFNGWAATPFINPSFPAAVNFYLVVWDRDYTPGSPNSGDFNFNFKARYGCAEQLCTYAAGDRSLTCNGSTYTLTIPVTGNNVTLTAADANATSITYSPNPLVLTNPGANNPVTSGTITVVYPVGQNYNVTITPTSAFAGCTPTTIAGYPPPGCCPPTLSCPASLTVSCASQVPAANVNAVTVGANCAAGSGGNCGAFCTAVQSVYANGNAMLPNGLTVQATLTALLQNNPITVGSLSNGSTCGFQLTNASCVLGILPGNGPTGALPANYMLNCSTKIQNTLIGHLIALQLNVRYNLQYNNNLNLANAPLNCVLLPAQVSALGLSANATIGDLIARVNLYLAMPCNGQTFAANYGALLGSALATINEFWNECGAGTTATVTHVGDVISNQTCADRYTITRTYQASTGAGAPVTCTQIITVNDQTPPTVTCPPTAYLPCSVGLPAPNPASVVTSDNCGGPVTVTHVSDVQTGLNWTRTYRGTDACQNTTTCTQIIELDDITPPQIACPAPLTVSCASQVPAPNVNLPVISNACPTAVVTHVGDNITYQTCANRYMITRVYQVSDGPGNASTCSQQIQVNDVTPPTITCPANVTIACGQAYAPNPALVNASDNCGGGAPTVTHVADTPQGNGSVLRVYRATDVCGNSATCAQTITGIDNTPPTITCPAPVTVSCASQVPPSNGLGVVANDNCGVPTVTFVNDAITYQTCANRYMITRTYRATDLAGLSATCSQAIQVFDQTPPTITCPQNLTLNCNAPLPPATPNSIQASDNCGNANVVVIHVGDVTNGNTVTRTYKATDACGNTATCTQLITMSYGQPSITCPAPITVSCASQVPQPNPNAVQLYNPCNIPGYTVLCVGDAITYQTCPNRYMITRTYTATFPGAGSVSCTQAIQVYDQTPPTVTCPANQTVACNVPPPTPNTGSVNASDNCGGGAVVITHVGDVPNAQTGVVARTYRATDVCGNSATCVQQITLNDVVPPTIVCPAPITVSCANQVPASNGMGVMANDNCGSATVTFVNDAITYQVCANRYMITRTYKATDAAGNTATCNQAITVFDQTPPTIACPANITVACGAQPPAPNVAAVTTTELCGGGAVVVTHVGDVTNGNTITRTYRATDVCGNSATCTQTIMMNYGSGQATVTCPAPITVSCASQVPAANPASLPSNNGCGVSGSVAFTGDAITYQTCPNRYMVTRTYTATFPGGGTAACTQGITVFDQTPPTVTCPANITASCGASVPPVNLASVTTSDNCGGGAVTVTHVGDVTNGNAVTRTYRATDVCGNSATCAQTISLNDNVPPTITCPPALTVSCASQVPPSNGAGATAYDNCGPATISFVNDAITYQTCANRYMITRTYKATDGAGLTATCSQAIQVFDQTPPTITCPANITVACGAQPPAPNTASITATDNCGGGAVVVTHVGDVTNGNTITRTYRATDVCGNSATCAQTILLNAGSGQATVTCPAPITVSCASQVPAANPASLPSNNGCGVAGTVTFTGDAITYQTCANRYMVTRTYTATFPGGGTATCTQGITVFDQTPPTITCPANITVACGVQPPAPNTGSVTATDNCGGGAVVVTHVGDVTNGNTITRTYRATDVCGNSATCAQTILLNAGSGQATVTCPAPITVSCAADVPAPNPASLPSNNGCGVAGTVAFTGDAITYQTCPNRYMVTRTYTATFPGGGTATCTQGITVFDQTPPTITCPANITVACGVQPPAPNTGSVTATDNCGGGAVVVTHVGDVTNGNTITRTYRATDVCGNSATCAQTILLNAGSGQATVTCPAPITVSCAADVPAPNPASLPSNNGCGVAGTVAFTGDAITYQTCPNRYMVTRTYTATFPGGGTATCTQGITVFDQTPPTITCPANITLNCNDPVPPATPNSIVASDNCGGGAVVVIHVGDVPNPQTNKIIRTYQATDVCGNSATCTQVITTTPGGQPTITCPAALTVSCVSQVPAPNPGAVTATNNCGVSGTVTFTGDAITYQTCPNTYMITRTYTATFPGGGTATCTQAITVIDQTPPTLTCPANLTVGCAPEVPAANPGAVVAVDNCGGGAVVVTHVGDVTNNDVVTRTYLATDVCGNTATCTQTITIQNTGAAPSLLCPDPLTVQCAADVPVPDPNTASVINNCGAMTANVSYVGSMTTGQTCPNNYTINRTYQAVFSAAPTVTCVQVITVDDQTPPVIACPANDTVACQIDVPAAQLDSVTATDNCAGPINLAFVGDAINLQTNTVTRTYQATDTCGNASTCNQIIAFNATGGLNIVCPAPITVSCPANVPAPNVASVTASDGCTVTACGPFCTYGQGAWSSPGGTHSNGLNTTATLNVLLQSGPFAIGDSTCGFEVADVDCLLGILPAGGPSVPLPQNFVLDCDETLDNTLTGQLLTLLLNIRYNDVYNNNADLGAADLACALTTSELDDLGLDSTATINDLIDLANTYLAANCNGTSYPNGFGGTINDAVTALNEQWEDCQNPGGPGGGSIPVVTFVGDSIVGQTCPGNYVIQRTYRATASTGASVTCVQTITVNDQTAPTGTCPADVMVSCMGDLPCGEADDPAVVALVQQIQAAYSDNCGGPVIVTFLSAFDDAMCSDPDSNGVPTFNRTFTFSVADSCGNADTCAVDFVAACQAFCTYGQGAYGNAGGTFSNGLGTTATLDQLLQSGGLVLGFGTCGFEVTTSACVINLLPAGGPSTPLPANFVLNCNEVLGNTLAGQLITLQLNLRYNDIFNSNLDLGGFGLSCLLQSSAIDMLGLTADATVNDLVALGNAYLGANCNGMTFANGFGGVINSAVTAVNEYWNDCQQQPDPCTGAFIAAGPTATYEPLSLQHLKIYPNPASTVVNVDFTAEFNSDLRLRLVTPEGRLVEEFRTTMRQGENNVQLDVSTAPAGLYLLMLVGPDGVATERLVIMRN